MKEQRASSQDRRVKLILCVRLIDREGKNELVGMFFAFFAIVVMVALTAYALYLDKPVCWVSGAGTLISVASIL
ncbi:MAG: hypothetical protein ACLU4J_13185 [Butyricimonas paravirosa]